MGFARIRQPRARHMKNCLVIDLGLMPYRAAWELQRRVVQARKANAVPDLLLLCEHPHVITLGRNGRPEHLRASEHLLRQMNVEFCSTDRGGDITYHGPGQLVGYPILNLAEIRRDVLWYVRQLEEVMIRATLDFGIRATRRPGCTGVWVDRPGTGEEKLAAIGVHLSRWVTSHGFAYNVATDLRYFDLIVPCGIADKRATSLEKLLNRHVELRGVSSLMAAHLGELFSLELGAADRGALETLLAAQEEQTAAAAS